MRYSEMSALLTCARKFQYEHEDGLIAPGERPALAFGSLWHKVHELAAGSPDLPSDQVVEQAAQAVGWNDPAKDFRTLDKARRAYPQWLRKYAGVPWRVLHTEVLHDTVLDPEVEPHGGRLDAVVETRESPGDPLRRWLVDYKTTSRLSSDWIAQYRISNQFRLYYLARALAEPSEQLAGVVVDLFNCTKGAVKTGKTDEERDGNHFYRLFIRYTPEQLAEVYQDYIAAVRLRDSYRQAGYFPKNTAQCWNCPFVDLCDTTDLELREHLKEGYRA